MENWRTIRHPDLPVFSEDPAVQEAELKENSQLADFSRARETMKDDPHRPVYHFTRPDGSLNDPNGLCFWEGKWHLFYQALDSCIHWGHAVSDDLVKWRDLPYAIAPSGEDHCFSGATCIDKENHRAIIAYYGFTGYNGYNTDNGYRWGIVVATSSDPLLLNWKKVKNGDPVITDCDAPCWTAPDAPPAKDQKPYQVFDPYIWKEDGVYYLLTGGYSVNPSTGRRFRQVYMHRCTDDNLEKWEFVKNLLDNDRFREAGDDGACPYFVPIGDGKRALFHFSHRGAPKYIVGDYDKDTLDFVPFGGGRFSSGYGIMVAPCVYPCGDGSVACVFNMSEKIGQDGWSGTMTMPRRMTLGGVWGDEIHQAPIDGITKLRKNHKYLRDVALTADEKLVCDLQGDCYELNLHLKSDMIPHTLEVEVLRSPDGEETTKITFFEQKGGMYAILPYTTDSVIMLDVSQSSQKPGFVPHPPEHHTFAMQSGEDLDLRIFVDKSIVEVFVNNKQCAAMRAYPVREDSKGIALLAKGKDVTVSEVSLWEMDTIYE